MPTAFVAVIRADQIQASTEAGPAGVTLAGVGLAGSGARAVLGLGDLAACTEPDERVAVLLDPPGAAGPLAGQVEAVLATLENTQGRDGDLVVSSVRPVTDTLKRVGAGNALTGTADREHHRFVAAPIATRLGLLRAALERDPGARTPGEILAALVAAGARVVAAG